MKKLFLSVLLLFFILCGCSQPAKDEMNTTNNTGSQEEISEENTENFEKPAVIYDNLPNTDMNGYVFRMMNRVMTSMHGQVTVEEITGDVLNDAVYNRAKKIEERFNMKFEEENPTPNVDAAKKTILAGEDRYALITTRAPQAYDFAQQGLLNNIGKLEYVDLSKPYWDKNLNAVLTIGGKRYFATGASNLPAYDFTNCLLFNKNMFLDMGLDYPYALVDSGTWTFDKFNELAKAGLKDLDGDGKMDKNDSYGFVSVVRQVLPSFWIAGGVLSISKNAEDIPYLSAGEEKFVTVYEKIFESVYDVWFKTDVSNDGNISDLDNGIFEDKRALFANSTFFYVNNLRNMSADFGIIPYPKLNETQENYYCRVIFMDLFGIPVTNQNLEYTGIIVEALASESLKEVIPAYYDITLKTKIARDVDSEKMVDLIFNNRVMDLGDTIYCDQIRDGIFGELFFKNDRNIVSKKEKMENAANKEISKTVSAFEGLD